MRTAPLILALVACSQPPRGAAPRHVETQRNDEKETEDAEPEGSATPPDRAHDSKRSTEERVDDQLERDWCLKDIDQSGDYEVTLHAVPTSLNGLAQCEDFPVGTKLPLHYRIMHDVELRQLKVVNVDNTEAIIRNIKPESHLLDQCKKRGHDAIVTAVDWTEYPVASTAYQQRGWAWSLYLTVAKVPTGQAMILAEAVLVDKYNHALCHTSFDRDDH